MSGAQDGGQGCSTVFTMPLSIWADSPSLLSKNLQSDWEDKSDIHDEMIYILDSMVLSLNVLAEKILAGIMPGKFTKQ